MASCVSDHEDAGEEEATYATVQLVDLRGNPLSPKNATPGGLRTSFFILGAIAACNVAFAGIFLNLVIYLTGTWGIANAVAANDVTNVMGTMFTFAFVGAFVSDAYLGRYWGCAGFLALYTLALASFSSLATITGQGRLQWVLLNLSLYLAGIGNGAFQPASTALGGDQLNTLEEKGSFFNYIFIFSNLGQGVALLVLSRLEDSGMWALGFGISAGMAGAALLLFLSGTPFYRHFRAGGNPLLRIAQVVVAAIRNRKLSGDMLSSPSTETENMCGDKTTALDPMGEGAAYHPLVGECHISCGSQLIHTDHFRWLDKAALQYKPSTSKWQTCSVMQVEEVKCLLSIFPIWLTCIIFNITVAQPNTTFLEQAAVMGQPSWITIAPSSMQVFEIGTNIVFGTVYDLISKRWGLTTSVTQLQRMGTGLLVALVAMVVAASVEAVRLQFNVHGENICIFWLAPQYMLLGISQVCHLQQNCML